ncbi:alpha/beta fold hydrolase [Mycolicibacterium poriferae]|uniref:alpha/beta fold hydrolase n=1 Tax=Mycolicibacterium poriferae TaxID=39694 RepID=UPI0024BB3645|nr:alpha/beta fold hydrolase [Mycolicibacterium poriferae]
MKYQRCGSGPALLLIHGISHRQNWAPVIPALARERDVIAVDLPGFGESPPLPGEVSVATLTDAVEEFIAEHDLGDVDIVGSSMGARMALEMARRGHGGATVALDPGGFWTDTEVAYFAATVVPSIALVRRIQPVLPRLVSNRVGRATLLLQFSVRPSALDRDLVLSELRNFARSPGLFDALEALIRGPKQQGAPSGTLRAPVVIGWGSKDRVTPPRQAQRALERFPDAVLHWFSECGHFPHWDRPAETVQLILDSTGLR